MRVTLFMTGAWITCSISALLSRELDFHISPTVWLSAEKIGIVNASVWSTAEPVTTAVFSAFFLKESLTLKQIFGIGIVLIGIVMAQIFSPRLLKIKKS